MIEDEQGHKVIYVHVPPSAEVHSYEKVVYDRVKGAGVKVTATSQIVAMYIRKQNIFIRQSTDQSDQPDQTGKKKQRFCNSYA